MNSCKNLITVILVLFFLCTVKVSAEDFSADMVMNTGKHVMQSKVFSSGDKIRMESMPGQEGAIIIIRDDKDISWMLLPRDKTYTENFLDKSQRPADLSQKSFGGETERTLLGVETIDGHEAQKYEVSYHEEGGKDGAAYQWLVREIPVKVETVDGTWSMEYKNISFAPQPPELFEIPSDYQKVQMPNLNDIMGMHKDKQ